MSKIICEICGTTYPASADRCPICGFSHITGRMEDTQEDSRQKTIFDFDEVNPEQEQPQDTLYFDDAPEEEENRPNVLLVVLLVIIITLLLSASAFLYFRFYLPNNRAAAPETQPTQLEQTEPTAESTEPQIPCQSLTLTSGVTELNRKGQLWLLHVTVLPEDTTDPLVFYSEDESVVTVTEGGRLEAIGEGETYVYIACGDKELRCSVVVRYEEEQTVPTEETLPESVELPPEGPAQSIDVPETLPPADIVLKLKDTDRSSNKKGVSFDLELDCDLKPEDVTWLTLDSRVAIVRNGTVTTIGPGSTKIVAQYKGQQVECIIRCNF